MRAGAFTDRRVIRLINRRFVPFYFNTGGPGVGKDENANNFIRKVTKKSEAFGSSQELLIDPAGRKSNTIAYFGAFSPLINQKKDSPNVLGIANGWKDEKESYDFKLMYPSKEKVFEFLLEMLKRYPEFNQFTADEKQLLNQVRQTNSVVSDLLNAALLYEDLGEYEESEKLFRRVHGNKVAKKADRVSALLGLLRIKRYQKKWDQHQSLISDAKKDLQLKQIVADHLVMETGYRLIDQKRYRECKKELEAAIRKYPNSTRSSEMRFYAGVASFFLKDKPAAYYHWCWVVERMPENRLARRAYIAAVHESFPYPNSELGFYRSKQSVSNTDIKMAYEKARSVYEDCENKRSKE